MGTDERELGKRITEAAALLPDEERKYILGYADGVIAMSNAMREAAPRQDSA